MGGIGKEKGTENLNVADGSLYRNEYSNLKLTKAAMGRGLWSNAQDR
jgi:hypothetical protein